MPQSHKIGVIICNLGTPAAPTVRAVGHFLDEFLGDSRVVELPKLFWTVFRKAIVIPLRAKRVAHSYQAIWTDTGSPLLTDTIALSQAVAKDLGDDYHVLTAMRYGQPSIQQAVTELLDNDIGQLVIVPLYPQFAASTTASTFDAVADSLRHKRYIPNIQFISHYQLEPRYIQALKHQVIQQISQYGQPDKFILSFHGLPQDMVDKGDPYLRHCTETANALATACNWKPEQWLMTFQSRVGPKAWLQPYTDQVLQQLPLQGCKHIAVMCPGFAIDCLETLEEINMQNREYFIKAGGEQFHYIAALNYHPSHVKLLAQLIRERAFTPKQQATQKAFC